MVKLQTDKEVQGITVKHLRTELETKTQTIRRQTDELAMLRESILELQRQNTQLRQQQHSQTGTTIRAPKENRDLTNTAATGFSPMRADYNRTDCSGKYSANLDRRQAQSPLGMQTTGGMQARQPLQQIRETQLGPTRDIDIALMQLESDINKVFG